MMKSLLLLTLLATAVSTTAQDQAKPAPAYAPTVPKPTLTEVRYGTHERHILDFWKADSTAPTPLAFIIHGGGWQGGEKERVDRFVDVPALLKAGISVVAINYRFVKMAEAEGIQPPVKAPLHDAARALQFVRSKAAEWNLDKTRIAASGGSAGACSSLYLAFHDDMADPASSDPIARESTRLTCAAVSGAQTSLDPKQLIEWTPNSKYGGHAFGFMDPNDRKTRDTRFAEFLEKRDSVLPYIKKYSPYVHVSKDDPPVYLLYTDTPAIGQPQRDPTHTSNYGVKLQEHCQALGTSCELVYPNAPNVTHPTMADFIIANLKK